MADDLFQRAICNAEKWYPGFNQLPKELREQFIQLCEIQNTSEPKIEQILCSNAFHIDYPNISVHYFEEAKLADQLEIMQYDCVITAEPSIKLMILAEFQACIILKDVTNINTFIELLLSIRYK